MSPYHLLLLYYYISSQGINVVVFMSSIMEIKLRKKWKLVLAFAGLWAFILFPIPFLPLFGIDPSPEATQALIIITIVVSIPMIFLVIIMK